MVDFVHSFVYVFKFSVLFFLILSVYLYMPVGLLSTLCTLPHVPLLGGKIFSLLLFVCVSLQDIQSAPSSPLSTDTVSAESAAFCVLDNVLGGKREAMEKIKAEPQSGRSRKRVELQEKAEGITVIQTEGNEPEVGLMTIS